MGKGDQRSKRGKIVNGSYGVKRTRKQLTARRNKVAGKAAK